MSIKVQFSEGFWSPLVISVLCDYMFSGGSWYLNMQPSELISGYLPTNTFTFHSTLWPQLFPFHLFFSNFLLDIFFIYILNAIPKVPYAPLPTHTHFLALEFPCTGAYKVCTTKGPLFPLMAD